VGVFGDQTLGTVGGKIDFQAHILAAAIHMQHPPLPEGRMPHDLPRTERTIVLVLVLGS